MYKISKFNHIYETKDKLCIYNSLTGSIAKTNNKSIKDLLMFPNQNVNSEYIKRMLNDGFIVESNVDEDAVAQLRHFDMVANKNLRLILLPTTACNFRCIYCYSSFAGKHMDEVVQDKLVNFVKKNIKDFDTLNIDWFGGEPLLKIDFINKLSQRLISVCHERGKRYFSSMTTNGYYLTEEVFRQMLKNRINLFMITLDGFKEIHNKNRKLINGDETFEKILGNLRSIRDNVKSSYFKIRIRTNVTKELIPRLGEYIKFLYDEFGQDKRFNFHFAAVNNYGGEAIKSIKPLILDSFDDVYDIMINSKYQLDYTAYSGLLKNQVCYSGRRNMYVIDPEGKVKKCTVTDNEYNELGYIDESGNMIIDENKHAKWLNYKLSDGSSCSSCLDNAKCKDYACPLVHNFGGQEIDCGHKYFNLDKILDLLTNNDNYKFVKKY